jgi:HEAT repeat protein
LKRTSPRRSVWVLSAALAGASLAGCKSSPTATDTAGTSASRSGSGSRSGSEGARDGYLPRTANSQRDELFFRVEGLVSQWDAAQADGHEEDARAFAAKVREEVDREFPTFAAASGGRIDVRSQYLAVKALGFSADPRATELLVARLADRDARLVGNALIALKIRSDPATPLPPILGLLRARAEEPRRFAPLALANVLLARERAGMPLESRYREDAISSLVAVVKDQDPYVRLHAAKAMGALKDVEANDYLSILLRDEHVQIRLAAAAALERIGDPRSFPKVVELLDQSDADVKPVVREVLVSFAERIQGAPLSAEEKAALGLDRRSWDKWYGDRSARAPASGRRAG